MILTTFANIWQPCAADTKDGICIPFADTSYIKFYAHGQVTAINLVKCTGAVVVMNLADWDYVIATDPNGDVYSYFVNPAIEEDNYDCPFYFEVTVDGTDYYTPCYMSIIDATCRMRDTIWMESDFAGFDCLGRWYGAATPQSIIAGNNSLSFNNGMLFWGTQSVLPTEYEFTNFDTCIVTKTKAVTNYEVEALSIAPYFVQMIEAIIGRGVIWLDAAKTAQYAVKPGTHFEKIRAFCRSQYDMVLKLTDCACEIHHECDLGYDYVPILDCQSALNYTCEITETASNIDFISRVVNIDITRNGNTMEVAFLNPLAPGTDVAAALDFASFISDCMLNGYAAKVITNNPAGTFYFYSPYISNIVNLGSTVTFDYSDFIIPPVEAVCIDESGWATDDTWADLDMKQNLVQMNPVYEEVFYLVDAELLFTLTVTGSPLLNAIWSSNVAFTQIDLTHISVELPQGGDITVTVDVFPELCGEVTIEVTVNDNPIYEGRFLAADATVVWDDGLREIEFTEASYYLNTSLSSLQWNVFNIGTGYTGGDPTTSTVSPFTLTTVGVNDDFVVELIITDIHGNVSKNYFLFGQNNDAAPDEDVVMWARATLAAFTGTSVDITTTYALPYNTYTFPIVADEVGLDADLDNTYEQTAAAAGVPVVFTHDYLGTGVFTGRVGVSFLESVPPPPGFGTYDALPFGLMRCEFVAQIV